MPRQFLAEIQAEGVKGSIHQGNIGVGDDCRRVVSEVIAEHGSLDILINNAGITIDKTVLNLNDSDWDKVLAVNLSGAFFLSQAALAHMIERGTGRIVNVSSIIGEVGNIGQANYAASKSGLFGLTKTLAKEAAFMLQKAGKLQDNPIGITVNTVTPGFVETEMVGTVPEKVIKRITDQIPVRRFARPRRSPEWCISWPPTPPATSPVRSGASTAEWTCSVRAHGTETISPDIRCCSAQPGSPAGAADQSPGWRAIWAKREDCNSGLAYGGNKTRKLEYLVPDALAQGADTLVSIGGYQSNHTRQVAAVAARSG